MLSPFKQKRVKYDPSSNSRDYIKEKQCFSVTGGQKTSVPPIELEDFKLSNMFNCYIDENEIKSRFGYSLFGNWLPLADPIVTIKQFFDYAGNGFLCVFTTKAVYKYNTASECFDLISPNEVVCDCEDAWTASANITTSNPTDWFRHGTKSVKFVVEDLFTTGLIGYVNFTSKNLTGYDYLHFYIKSSIDTASGDLQILLDDTDNCVSPLEEIDIPAISAGVDTEVFVKIATPSALTAVLSVGIKNTVDASCSVWMDQIAAVSCFSGTTADKFSTEVIYDTDESEVRFIASNFVNSIMAWNGTGNWFVLEGTQDRAKFIKNYFNFLIKAYCNTGGGDYPTKIEWSVNTKPQDMTGAGSGNNSLTSAAGNIQMIEEIQSQLAIIRENSITNMFIVAGVYEATQTPIPFEFSENKVNNIGTPSSWSVQKIGDKLLLLGWDGLYIYDLYSFENINTENFSLFISSINPEQLQLSHSVLIRELSLYLLFVPPAGETTTDVAWVFDYNKKICLGTWQFHDPVSACGSFKETTGAFTIGEIIETIGALTWRVGDSNPTSMSSVVVLGDSNGYLYKINKNLHSDNGNAIVSSIDTKAYCVKIGWFVRFAMVIIDMVGTEIEILISKDGGKTFVSKQSETSIPSDNKVRGRKIDTTSESIMFRFKKSSNNGWFKIMGWVIRFIEKQRLV